MNQQKQSTELEIEKLSELKLRCIEFNRGRADIICNGGKLTTI